MTNLNIIHAMRQRNLMAAGALYALGHDGLAERAESTFPAIDALSHRLKELSDALDRDFGNPYFHALFGGDAPRPIPDERMREYDEVDGWLKAAMADQSAIEREIEAIIESLYDDATIVAEERQSL